MITGWRRTEKTPRNDGTWARCWHDGGDAFSALVDKGFLLLFELNWAGDGIVCAGKRGCDRRDRDGFSRGWVGYSADGHTAFF